MRIVKYLQRESNAQILTILILDLEIRNLSTRNSKGMNLKGRLEQEHLQTLSRLNEWKEGDLDEWVDG